MIRNRATEALKLLMIGAGLTVLLAAGNVSAAGTNDILPAKQYRQAYESLSTAEWLAKRDMNEDAADLYKESLKLFQQLASDYPKWQTNAVAFRINYCREGLSKLDNARKTDQVKAEPSGILPPGNPPSRVVLPAAPMPAAPLPVAPAPIAPAPITPAPAAKTPEQPAVAADASGAEMAEALRLEKSGDVKGALAIYRSVLAQNKQQSAALGGAGRCLLKLGRTGEAHELLFQWSVIPSPDNGINLLLALILCNERQFTKAIQLAGIVLNEDASNAAAHVIMGAGLAGTGQNDAAISEMQKAVAIDPSLSEAHYNLAWLMLKKRPDQKKTAGEYYLNALKFGAVPDPVLEKSLQK